MQALSNGSGIVFDFIRPEVASAIFAQVVDSVLDDLRRQDYKISVSAVALEQLAQACLADLSNGGRGIRNQVERHLVNPLARALFDVASKPGASLQIKEIHVGPTTTMMVEVA